MKTEARKAYEKQMPRWEMVLRDRLWVERCELKVQKGMLQFCLMSDSCNNREKEYKDNVKLLRAAIKAEKHIIQILKNGLPQRRPAGVMAKCPFCGAKQWQAKWVKADFLSAKVPALWAFELKDTGVVVAKCARCGAMFKMYNQKHSIQDAIEAWNRRA